TIFFTYSLFKISDPYLACLLSPSLYSINEWFDLKLRTNPRSGTKNMFSSSNGEPFNSDPVSLFSFKPPRVTPNHGFH
ncbi:hypothetical protein Q502_13250, partial [Mesotoga sp. Brook.08.YT.4.2.5.2.]|uniref:hypothetical protein n=1 Tax=Mesotoga sp. Brook.08.YT.4.2.5.2. TaxID=1405291 RepID=UPI000E2AE202